MQTYTLASSGLTSLPTVEQRNAPSGFLCWTSRAHWVRMPLQTIQINKILVGTIVCLSQTLVVTSPYGPYANLRPRVGTNPK